MVETSRPRLGEVMAAPTLPRVFAVNPCTRPDFLQKRTRFICRLETRLLKVPVVMGLGACSVFTAYGYPRSVSELYSGVQAVVYEDVSFSGREVVILSRRDQYLDNTEIMRACHRTNTDYLFIDTRHVYSVGLFQHNHLEMVAYQNLLLRVLQSVGAFNSAVERLVD